MKTGIQLIVEERQRQIVEEGYTADYDDRHEECQLLLAGMSYIVESAKPYLLLMPGEQFAGDPKFWFPWNEKYWKPKDKIRNLVKAGALIAAEIDRLQRLQKPEDQDDSSTTCSLGGDMRG